MSVGLGGGSPLWRVGYHADPLGYTPWELYGFSHRFDDVEQRFRTLYVAETAETCLREVLADFRPNLAARLRHIEHYGPAAANDFVAEPVTATWRIENVLAPVVLDLTGPAVDLTDPQTRQAVEDRHQQLLVDHGLKHLDLHEITTPHRVVTQTIAAELFDGGAAAVKFQSRLDGGVCIALFEYRGAPRLAGNIVPLADPPPAPLRAVAHAWNLALESTG